MEIHEQKLRELFLNKAVKDIEFFDTDLKYLSPDMEQLLIIDGGVQFQLNDDFVSFVFSSELEYFQVFPQKIDSLDLAYELNGMGAKNLPQIDNLVGTTITELSVKWNFYENLDEEGELIGEREHTPFELLLCFNNNSFLQIAAISFSVRQGVLTDFTYDSEAQLLISVNEKQKIVDLMN